VPRSYHYHRNPIATDGPTARSLSSSYLTKVYQPALDVFSGQVESRTMTSPLNTGIMTTRLSQIWKNPRFRQRTLLALTYALEVPPYKKEEHKLLRMRACSLHLVLPPHADSTLPGKCPGIWIWGSEDDVGQSGKKSGRPRREEAVPPRFPSCSETVSRLVYSLCFASVICCWLVAKAR